VTCTWSSSAWCSRSAPPCTAPRGLDRRPILSDLRYSGRLEQDADTVLFVQQPCLYQAPIRQAPAVGSLCAQSWRRTRGVEGGCERLASLCMAAPRGACPQPAVSLDLAPCGSLAIDREPPTRLTPRTLASRFMDHAPIAEPVCIETTPRP
jgi:hypothetical protein